MSSSSSIIKVKEKGEESVLDHSPVAKETKDIDKSVDRGLDESDFIKSTSSVLVHHSDGRTFFLDSGSKSNHAMIGRINVNTTPLIGERYGTVFQVERFTLKKVEGYDLVDPGSESSVTVDQIANDNRDFVDTNTAQKLTESDIRKMKEEGKESETIIKALVENSDTWRSKTQYSQQKWLQRKQKKYSPRIKVVKNTARNVCDAYFAKHREKVCSLRSDTLALLLSHANVFAGGQVLLLDSCMGVVTAALLERMGCQGRVMALYPGTHPAHDAVRRFPYSEEELARCLVPVPTAYLGRLAEPDPEGFVWEEDDDWGKEDSRPIEEVLEEYGRFMDAKDVPQKVREWMRQGSDSLVIASKYDPTPALRAMLPLLTPSRPFVVFSELVEPLVSCLRWLQLSGTAVNLQLCDTWMREFQVLPGRTHPLNSMSSSGGYLLTGIKTTNNPDPRRPGAGGVGVYTKGDLNPPKGKRRRKKAKITQD